MRTIIPPPPRRKSLWKRYAEGERLNPSFDPIPLKTTVIPLVTKSKETTRISYSKLPESDLLIIIIVLILISLTMLPYLYKVISLFKL